jgi:CRISPR-associated protein Cmr4
MHTRLLFTHALSPLHAGTGQGVGVIDLPVAREKATSIPYLPGSSFKGVLRDACSGNGSNPCTRIFGPEPNNASDHAGSALFTDQRLLLLPIRSLAGTFAWVTSPYLLKRFQRDITDATIASVPHPIPEPSEKEACCSSQNALRVEAIGKVVLEDLDLELRTEQQQSAHDWADWLAQRIFPDAQDWQTMLHQRFCIVHDNVFNFLLNTATEITARIKLADDTKTVARGGLWYEEALPTETILSGLLVATPLKATAITPDTIFTTIAGLVEKPLQFGGSATVGRGLCRVRLVHPEGGQ